MFVGFLYELRQEGVPVGTQEALTLAQALHQGLHENSLTQFYHLAKSVLVHRESHLDPFDVAFFRYFHNAQLLSLHIHDELLDWLKNAKEKREFTAEELALLQSLDPDELRKQFEERLREQDERHDRGTRWIGTGGASPFGNSGAAREGIRVGGTSQYRRALAVASARNFKAYRNDLQLDVRQWGIALRKLRHFARENGELELDVEETIEATARNAGELEVVVRPPRRPNTRVILMLDVGGSMDPYVHLVERLFSAASKATHFKEFRSYYFHNCVYGKVWYDENFSKSISLNELIRTCGKQYKLVFVGDAAMAPYELFSQKGSYFFGPSGDKAGVEWLVELAAHFEHSIWLNPEDPRWWQGTGSTREAISRIFPMFPLTLDGLTEAIRVLNGNRPKGPFGGWYGRA